MIIQRPVRFMTRQTKRSLGNSRMKLVGPQWLNSSDYDQKCIHISDTNSKTAKGINKNVIKKRHQT